MVRLTRIYTRTGDQGTTSLGGGARVAKHDLRIEVLGAIDEANAAIGVARSHVAKEMEASEILARIQNDLFDLGADLCQVETNKDAPPLRVADAQVLRLEQEIDRMNSKLSPLSSFVLPGGNTEAAFLHLARTLVRRAERAMTKLAASEPINEAALRYINRLSDHLFVLSRYLNNKGGNDILWVPGQNR